MLYDPKWKRQTVVDLIAWLETKPTDGMYNYHNYCGCLIAQWMEGIPHDAWSTEARDLFGAKDAGRIAWGNGLKSDWTYGAALARARCSIGA